MFPSLSRADTEVVELRFREFRGEAARHRLADKIPVAQRGGDGEAIGRKAMVDLVALGLKTVALLQSWGRAGCSWRGGSPATRNIVRRRRALGG